jgi:hypothetical protein
MCSLNGLEWGMDDAAKIAWYYVGMILAENAVMSQIFP